LTSLALDTARRRRPWRAGWPSLWLAAAGLAVGLLCLAPPVYLLVRISEAPGDAIGVILTRTTLTLAWNTLLFAILTTLVALGIALPMAWLLERTDLAGRRVLGVLAALPLAIPTYVGALVFISAFGPRGLLQQLLEPLGVERLPPIYGLTGATMVLALFTYPYLLMTLRPALANLDPRLEELSRTFGYGRWTTFQRVILPQLRPAAVSGGLLVGLYTLSDFGAPALMRFDSLTRAIFIRYGLAFDRTSAAALALVLGMLAITVVLLDLATRSRFRYDSPRSHGQPASRVALGRWRWAAYGFIGTVLGMALVLPLSILTYWLIRGIGLSGTYRSIWSDIADSVTAAGLAALAAVIAALPVAILSVRYRGQVLSRAVEALSFTGYALPGLVVALALVFASIRLGPLYQSLTLLVIAYVLLFLPAAVGAIRVSLLQVRPSMEEAARGLGRRPWQVLTTITVPLAGRGMLAGAALVFLTAMKELPATMLLAPTEFRTLALSVWSAAGDARFAAAALPALILVAISAFAVLLLNYGDRRGRGRPPSRARAESRFARRAWRAPSTASRRCARRRWTCTRASSSRSSDRPVAVRRQRYA
jgi:iron(III) transport system permease protein